MIKDSISEHNMTCMTLFVRYNKADNLFFLYFQLAAIFTQFVDLLSAIYVTSDSWTHLREGQAGTSIVRSSTVTRHAAPMGQGTGPHLSVGSIYYL